MAPIKTLILTALLPEAQALKQGLQLTKVAAPVPFWTGDGVALAVVGIHAARLAEVAQIPAVASIRGVLMAGLAGALAPDLAVGDVVIDAPASFTGALPHGARLGRIHTADAIIATPAEKQRLFASTSCVAVDMETETARRFAKERGAAFLTVRAISDAAKDALDPALLHLIDDQGRPRIGRAVAMLCRNPEKLPSLLHLQRATTMALSNLAAALREIRTSGWPDGAAIPRHSA